ncbi:MAG: hypothetical protein QOI29_5142 [Mycobacterium sp.]|jgi:hypothetical protein|nr:hypothetical protein [Mycobacterium sp.]
MAGSRVGYMHQLLAGAGWTSVFMLPLVRRPTRIVAGSDDPIIPLADAKIMNRLLPNSALHIHDGGHVELICQRGRAGRGDRRVPAQGLNPKAVNRIRRQVQGAEVAGRRQAPAQARRELHCP